MSIRNTAIAFFVVLAIAVIALCAAPAFGQALSCNGATGKVTIPGTALSVDCGAAPVVVPPVVTPPSNPSVCTASASTGLPVILKRTCTASYVVGASRAPHSNAPVSDLSIYLGGGTYAAYTYLQQGYGLTIPAGNFVSLAFTPTTTAKMNVQNNATFGGGPLWTISTTPGNFAPTGAACVRKSGGQLFFGVLPQEAGICILIANTTYYLNFSPVDANGVPACGANPTPCATVTIGEAIGVSN